MNLSKQMKRKAKIPKGEKEELHGNMELMVSTGSTLLDLAISGGRKTGGGIPGGILIEIFGPSGAGKTVLLCEIAGSVMRGGGAVRFQDPEARLDEAFSAMFGMSVSEIDYSTPDTVTEFFKPVRKWEPENTNVINGIFGDSLAALSTDMEMNNEEGDKMGMRRAKEMSEQCRKTCRVLKQKNFIMVCSNQIRDNPNAGMYEAKWTVPGGKAFPFYASVRLKVGNPKKIKKEIVINGKKTERVTGITTVVEVHKNSVWSPYRTAPVSIMFDYGVDDVRQNLQFCKDYSKSSKYNFGTKELDKSMDKSIVMVEENNWEIKLKKATIKLWAEVEERFVLERKPKER